MDPFFPTKQIKHNIYISCPVDLNAVEILLRDQRVDPSINKNSAIVWASQKGLLAVVERLLQDPRVDPSSYDSKAIFSGSYLAVRQQTTLSINIQMKTSATVQMNINYGEERGFEFFKGPNLLFS